MGKQLQGSDMFITLSFMVGSQHSAKQRIPKVLPNSHEHVRSDSGGGQ